MPSPNFLSLLKVNSTGVPIINGNENDVLTGFFERPNSVSFWTINEGGNDALTLQSLSMRRASGCPSRPCVLWMPTRQRRWTRSSRLFGSFFGAQISYRLVYQDERYELALINSLSLSRDVL